MTARQMFKRSVLEEITRFISSLGTCNRAKVGCLIVKEGRILSSGYNGSPPGRPHCEDVGCEMENDHCVRTVHAEANAIAFAARHGVSIEGATLFTYGWEDGICNTCRKLAESAGIVEFVEVPL